MKVLHSDRKNLTAHVSIRQVCCVMSVRAGKSPAPKGHDDAEPSGNRAAIDRGQQLTGLESYHLYWATQAELLLRAGDVDAAATAFARARELATNTAEQQHLDRRIAGVSE